MNALNRLPKIAFFGLLVCCQYVDAGAWHRDVGQAFKVAQAEQKPVILFLSMNGCTYCDKMIQTTLSDLTVRKAIGSGYVPAAIKASERPDIVRQLRVRSFPTTVLVSPTGQVLEQLTGYVAAEKLTSSLRNHTDEPIRQAQRVQHPAPVVRAR